MTGRGALRLHPMGIDGPIDAFAPFHNVNCPRGFLYFNRQVGRLNLVPSNATDTALGQSSYGQRAEIAGTGGAKESNSGFILGRLRMRPLGCGGLAGGVTVTWGTP